MLIDCIPLLRASLQCESSVAKKNALGKKLRIATNKLSKERTLSTTHSDSVRVIVSEMKKRSQKSSSIER